MSAALNQFDYRRILNKGANRIIKASIIPKLAAFFAALTAATAIFALLGIAPFGDDTLLVSDMYSQYSCFFGDVKSLLSDGLFYSLHKSIGGDIYSLVAYYLASPLNLIFLLFPLKYLPEAVSVLYILKLSLAALTMSCYLSARGTSGAANLALSLAFSFSAYFTLYSINIMWLDALTLLPLISLGIERLVDSTKFSLYTLSLAGAIFCNYYIGYMLCIFSVLYFLYALLRETRPARMLATTGIRFAISSLVAGGLNAVLLIPVGLSMSGGKVEPPDFMSPEYVRMYLLIVSAAAAIFLWDIYSRAISSVAMSTTLESDSATLSTMSAPLGSDSAPRGSDSTTLSSDSAPLGSARPAADNIQPTDGSARRNITARIPRILLLAAALGATGAHFYILIGFDKSFRPDELVSRLLVGASDAADYAAGLPNIYCGVGVAILALAYLFDRTAPLRERVAHMLLLGALAASCFVAPLNLAWHLFNPPTWFCYRYSFLISFILIITARNRLERSDMRPAVIAAILCFAGASLTLAGNGRFTKPIIILNFLLIALYSLFLSGMSGTGLSKTGASGTETSSIGLSKTGASGVKPARLAVSLLLCGELVFSAALTLDSVASCYGDASSAAAYREFVDTNTARLDAADRLSDGGFYRCELLEPRSFNDSLMLGYNGISHYSSSMKLSDAVFLQRLGFPADRAYVSYNGGGSLAADSLLGIRYLVGDDCIRADGELLAYVTDGVYENRAALDLAIPVWSDELDELSLTGIPLDNVESLYSALLGYEPGLFEPVEFDVDADANRIEVNFVGNDRPVVMYAELPRLQYVRLTVNGEAHGNIFDGYTQGIIPLGCFEDGERVTILLESDYEIAIDRLHIRSENLDALSSAVEKLGGTHTTLSGSTLTVSITDPNIRRLLLTLPYSDGLHISADGKALPAGSVHETLDALTLIELPQGIDSLTITYTPPGFILGAAISLASFALFITVAVIKMRMNIPAA